MLHAGCTQYSVYIHLQKTHRSPCVLDFGVPERAKMAFEMKDRLDQLRRSSVRVTLRGEIAIL